MTRRFPPLCLAGLALVLAAVPAGAQGSSGPVGPGSVVLQEKHAVLLDLPELVAPGAVTRAEWSSSGRYVLAARERVDVATALAGRPAMESALVLWTARTQSRRELWKSSAFDALRQFQWLPGADAALAVVRQPRPAPPPGPRPAAQEPPAESWLLRVDAARGLARPLFRAPEDFRLAVSPSRPLAALYGLSDHTLRVIGADGAARDLGAAVRGLDVIDLAWSADGRLHLLGIPPAEKGAAPPRPGWYTLDLAAGMLSGPGAPPQRAPAAPAAGPFRLREGRTVVREATASRETRPLWLESLHPSDQSLALVSADAAGGLLSPRNDAVLYLSEGAAWVRPLLSLDRAAFEQAREAARRQVLISNMKQVGLGLLIYAEDHDGMLPPAGSDVEALVQPYTKVTSIFEGFVYEFPGGKLSEVEKPSETRLGYVPARGGRVIVFVDGHVRFEKEP